MSSGLRWGNPWAFYLLLFVVIYGAVFYLFRLKNEKKLRQSFGDRIAPWLSDSISYEKIRLKFFFEVTALVFLIIALARPQLGQSQQDVKSEGIELMILADVSESMLSEDVKPSRLEMMKIELEKLVDAMPGNKMGLIAFAGSSALISPLTTDPSALKMYIQSLDTHSVTNQGTNFQVALSYAREAFEKGGITQSEQVKATRVILILSDGEDQDKNALEEAKKLSEDGVYILTVAYGTEKGGTIPSRDYMGNLIGSKKDKSGQVIVTQVHGDFLKELAQAAHGSFFTSQFGGNHVREIEDKINQFEKTQFASNMNVQYDEKFMYPLCLGFCLLLLSFYISTRKRQTAVWKSLYEK